MENVGGEKFFLEDVKHKIGTYGRVLDPPLRGHMWLAEFGYLEDEVTIIPIRFAQGRLSARGSFDFAQDSGSPQNDTMGWKATPVYRLRG